MISRILKATLPLALFLCGVNLQAKTYYIDAEHGNDTSAGTSRLQAWQTLERVNHGSFQPGDRILFRSGDLWNGQLVPPNSGVVGKPIIIDRYGAGAFPRLDGQGKVEDVVYLHNIDEIEVRDLEITNHGEEPVVRRGIYIVLGNFGTAQHIVISGLYIHDVNGTNARKDNGGIIFRTIGGRIPSRFDGLMIEKNIVWRVDRSGIAAESYYALRTHWFPSLHVVIRDNYIEDLGGDGIVPWATDGALVEDNIARKCNQRSTEYNAGIWQWSTDNTTFRLNEVSETRGTLDGEGFDSDYNSRNTHFEYNYSHDNDGGFMLICTPVVRDERNNVGNTGTVVRYNISHADSTRLINLSGADDVTVADNIFYVGAGHNVQMVVSDWGGWSRNAIFQGNSFYVDGGTLRFGHSVKRRLDGTYLLAHGWGPALNIVYTGNHYSGKMVDPPSDYKGAAPSGYRTLPPQFDWTGPVFNPARPQGYPAFLRLHRAWIVHLFEQQFGHAPNEK